MRGLVSVKVVATAPCTVLSVLGTRPEVIKLAPVIRAIAEAPGMRSRVLVTAQHRDLLDQMLSCLGIRPDADLDLMRAGQTLTEVTSRVLEGTDRILEQERPDMVLVQGDTTTVFAASLAAFYRRVPVGHVEAGLRSFDLANPFPEEANRRLTSQVTALHFAPTRRAQQHLLAEQVPAERIVLSGNTVVDALLDVVVRPDLPPPPEPWRHLPEGAIKILVTLHRRETWGERLAGLFRALRDAADVLGEAGQIVYPVHPQPRVRSLAEAMLRDHPRIALVEPLDYLHNVAAMKACTFIVTDSGGIQEEAPVLGKPVLVLREVTERPEAVEAGTSWLVGTEERAVYDAIIALATQPWRRERMASPVSPFGDGRASGRIVAAIRRSFGLAPLADEPPDLEHAYAARLPSLVTSE